MRPALRLTRPEPTEAQAMGAIRTALAYHPRVRGVWRINSGAAWLKGKGGADRPVRFHDIPGCADLIGILDDGRWLAVECKRPSTRGRATPEQMAFLSLVRGTGGVAFVAAAADEVLALLEDALRVTDARRCADRVPG